MAKAEVGVVKDKRARVATGSKNEVLVHKSELAKNVSFPSNLVVIVHADEKLGGA